jgi:uncharacterized protein
MFTAVADTSVLIAFSAIKRLELLGMIFREIAVPKAVFREVVTHGQGWVQASQLQEELASAEWLMVIEVPNMQRTGILPSHLGAGESEVISLAIETGLPALIDDLKARETAARCGLPVIGTLGVLARNKRRGHISAAKALVDQMRMQGIYFGESLIRRFLQDLDEI